MPVQISYENENELLTVTIDGEFSPDEYLEVMENIIDTDDISPGVNTIWDLRNMAFHNIDMAFQSRIIEHRKRFDRKRNNAKIALVSNYSLAEPLLTVFGILSQENNFTRHQVFDDLVPAREWMLSQDD